MPPVLSVSHPSCAVDNKTADLCEDSPETQEAGFGDRLKPLECIVERLSSPVSTTDELVLGSDTAEVGDQPKEDEADCLISRSQSQTLQRASVSPSVATFKQANQNSISP